MAAPPVRLLDHLHRLAAPADDPTDDAALLDRFVRQHDGAAFAVLVARHGGMVLRVCRRVLGDIHAAEDAFQASFLVLARRAAAIRRRESVAAWLHGVAYRVSCRARASAAGRQRREAHAPAVEPAAPHTDPLEQMTVRELLAALEEEIQGLPHAYRLPVVLCCLEGLSQEEAARRLGATPGSVRAGLERGRKRLHERLARRGLALAAALGAAEVVRGVAAGAPAALAAAAVRIALLDGAGDAVAGAVPANIAALTKGVLQAMFLKKLRTVTALVFAVALTGLGMGVVAYRTAAAEQEGEAAPAPHGANPAPPAKGRAENNLPDGPMPTPALVRLEGKDRVAVRVKVRGPDYVRLADGRKAPVLVPDYYPQTYHLALSDIRALDSGGMKVDRKVLTRLLAKERLAVVYQGGQKVDPLHLHLLREGTLVLVLPALGGFPNAPDPFAPPGDLAPPPPLPPAGPAIPPPAPSVPLPGVSAPSQPGQPPAPPLPPAGPAIPPPALSVSLPGVSAPSQPALPPAPAPTVGGTSAPQPAVPSTSPPGREPLP